ncbi:MAG: hypothetical protein ACKVU4_05475 [Phycisphaerales bacterium]
MPPRPFNAKRHYHELGELLRPIDVESALLFCNHVLMAWRGDECDPVVRNLVDEIRLPCSPFFVHLAARQVLLRSLGQSNRRIGTGDFKRLFALLWELLDHDPAMLDPGWKQSDPTGTLIRYVGLQQNQFPMPLQVFGLTVALFTQAMPATPDEKMDIPARLQEALEMDPLVFMRAGIVAAAVRGATSGSVKLAGTACTAVVMAAAAGVVGAGVKESWLRFVELTACTQAGFKEESRQHVADPRYELYRFNVLRRRPLIDLGDGRYLAIDRQLVFIRTTLGMYYDLLGSDGEDFTRAFGHRLANLVGTLAAGACGRERVWSEANLPKAVRDRPPSRNADHAFVGSGPLALIECKALTPKLRLLMLGEPTDTDALVERLVDAVRQLTLHAAAIREGKWATLGLPARESYGVVVTYGEIPTVNGVLFRNRVAKLLSAEGITPLPYIVLAVCQFDSLIRAVEHGRDFGTAVVALCENVTKGFPGPLESELSKDAISAVTRAWGRSFFDTVPGFEDDADEETTSDGRGADSAPATRAAKSAAGSERRARPYATG